MNFTDSPYEPLMQEPPQPYRPELLPKPLPGSPCYGCSFWQGRACVGVCFQELLPQNMEDTSGQVGPK